MAKLMMIVAAFAALLAGATAHAQSERISDWSKVVQQDGDYAHCYPAIKSSDSNFPNACFVGVRELATGRTFNVLGFYNQYGIPRSNPDARVEALPQLLNPRVMPTAPPAPMIEVSRPMALADGSKVRNVIYVRSTNRFFGYVLHSTFGPARWSPVFWSHDGKFVSSNVLQGTADLVNTR